VGWATLPVGGTVWLQSWLATELAGTFKYCIQHGFRQSSGECVLLAGVITSDERDLFSELSFCQMTELWFLRGQQFVFVFCLEVFPDGIPADAPQSDHHANRHNLKCARQKSGTLNQLVTGRLIIRRGAMTGSSDGTVSEFKSVFGRGRFGLVCKSGPMQCTKQPVTTAISGKHSACSVGAVCGGCKADNQHSSIVVPEVLDRFAPVSFAAIGGPFLFGDAQTVGA